MLKSAAIEYRYSVRNLYSINIRLAGLIEATVKVALRGKAPTEYKKDPRGQRPQGSEYYSPASGGLANSSEREASRPPNVETDEVQAAIASIPIQNQHTAVAIRNKHRLVQEDNRPLPLHFGILDPEVEGILRSGTLELCQYFLARNFEIKLD